MKLYGLLGHPLSHSFSKNFFANKFAAEDIHATYQNFDLENIDQFRNLIGQYPELQGMNVTIPYKQAVMQFLDELDATASAIGAVNVIKVSRKANSIHLKGYNSDVVGFSDSIRPLLNATHKNALVLGNGGASKAVIYALHQMGITTQLVSRHPSQSAISYEELNEQNIHNYQIIVNCTPLGMFPHTQECPALPYSSLDSSFVCFDLIYNPEKTQFLEIAESHGAIIKNGHEMLILQALESWRIWNM